MNKFEFLQWVLSDTTRYFAFVLLVLIPVVGIVSIFEKLSESLSAVLGMLLYHRFSDYEEPNPQKTIDE